MVGIFGRQCVNLSLPSRWLNPDSPTISTVERVGAGSHGSPQTPEKGLPERIKGRLLLDEAFQLADQWGVRGLLLQIGIIE